MREFKETFGDIKEYPIKLSSAGLMYYLYYLFRFKHYGKDIVKNYKPELNEKEIDIIYKKLYSNFVESVDAIDNGINIVEPLSSLKYHITTDISSQIKDYYSIFDPKTPEDENDLFKRCMCLIGGLFIQKLNFYCNKWIQSYQILKIDYENMIKSPTPCILQLSDFYPWKEHIYTIEKEYNTKEENLTKYAVYKDSNGSFRVQAVPITPESFISRLPLPEPWRGLRDEELSKKIGINGCIFVHSSGFIGGNKTKEGALKMAIDALNFNTK